jgi:hypothetical protein
MIHFSCKKTGRELTIPDLFSLTQNKLNQAKEENLPSIIDFIVTTNKGMICIVAMHEDDSVSIFKQLTN